MFQIQKRFISIYFWENVYVYSKSMMEDYTRSNMYIVNVYLKEFNI